MPPHKIGVPQRGPKNDDSLVFCGNVLVASPHHRVWINRVSCLLQHVNVFRRRGPPIPDLGLSLVNLDLGVLPQLRP